jgi:uncharacterized membrane protein
MGPRQLHRAALLFHLMLVVGIVVRDETALGWVIASLLLLPLPGIARGRTYTCAWASMLVGFYVAGYLAAGYARPQEKFGAFLLAAIAALDYLSLMLFVRISGRVRAALAARAEHSGGAAG